MFITEGFEKGFKKLNQNQNKKQDKNIGKIKENSLKINVFRIAIFIFFL